MWLLVLYMIFVGIVGLGLIYVGFAVESMFGSHTSLMFFLAANTVSLWLCWLLAVKLTEPKAVP